MLRAIVLCFLDLIKCWHSEAIFLVLTHIDVATVCLNTGLFHQLGGKMFVFTGLSAIIYSQPLTY